MNHSYWEKHYATQVYDLVIVGAGFTGLNAALHFKTIRPDLTVLVIDRGVEAFGASTKNAGFACFGSVTEILADLQSMSEDEVVELIEKRWSGIQQYQRNFEPHSIHYNQTGSVECFTEEDNGALDEAMLSLQRINKLVERATKEESTFQRLSSLKLNEMGLKRFHGAIFNPLEGVLNPVLVHQTLMRKCRHKDIDFLLGSNVTSFTSQDSQVSILINHHKVKGKAMLLATNAYTQEIYKNLAVEKAKNQVYITNEIKGLKEPVCGHFRKGFVYFRTVGNRILIGGARDMDHDFQENEHNHAITEYLLNFVRDHIEGCEQARFESSWLGYIGVGPTKKVLIEEFQDHCWIAARLGGMGVAIAQMVGKEVVEKIINRSF